MLCAQGAYAQDPGNIAVMPDYYAGWGDFGTETVPGMQNDQARKTLANVFYYGNTHHLDQFDFLVVMTNFQFEMTEGGRAANSFFPPVCNCAVL